MKVGAEYYFYHNDHLGTPQKMTAVNGLVVWAAKYSSFGKAEVDPGSGVENNLRFPGQYYDGETGLHQNWNRYYDPTTGRYITPDPIGLDGGINLFAYTENNPINLIDPKGLQSTVKEVKPFINLIKQVKKAAKKAKDGKSNGPCFCMSTVEQHYCQCVYKNKLNPEAMAECICIGPNPDSCIKSILEHYPDIINQTQ
ncbi:MAG: hypothetical protein GY865_19455 [candidate division Zixibacteria bacterium]|nr:hypothetical protein [candidate division Zixibacteria bacterium]